MMHHRQSFSLPRSLSPGFRRRVHQSGLSSLNGIFLCRMAFFRRWFLRPPWLLLLRASPSLVFSTQTNNSLGHISVDKYFFFPSVYYSRFSVLGGFVFLKVLMLLCAFERLHKIWF